MTSATLFREGLDLDGLLAELDEEHPGQVHVLEVSHGREGGVFGFFARPKVGVHYTLTPALSGAQDTETRGVELLEAGPRAPEPLDALIEAAEMVETGRVPAAVGETGAGGDTGAGNVEFARMLLELASRKAAERDPAPEPDLLPDAVADPVPDPRAFERMPEPRATYGQARHEAPESHPAPTTALELRRRLAELGVPVACIPTDAPHRYAVVEELVRQLPEPAPLPTGADTVVVVAGPAGALAHTAHVVAERMGLATGAIWTFGCPSVGGSDRRLIETSDALALAAAVRRSAATAVAPTLVAVITDEPDAEPGIPSAASIIRALSPDAFWLHVDATRKSADTAALAAELGTPSALVVAGAARTASPASVWELGVPVALLDGRPASRSAWAVLILDKLGD